MEALMTRRQCMLTQIVLDFFSLHMCLLASSVFLNIDDGTWTSESSEAWEPQTARIIPSSSSWILVLLHTNTTGLNWKYTFLLYCPCETLEHVCLHVLQLHTATRGDNSTLCWRAALPYAFSQSRADLSSSTNVNIAGCIGELSNTLTHNLFQIRLTHSESVIMEISQNATCSLSKYVKISSIVMCLLLKF